MKKTIQLLILSTVVVSLASFLVLRNNNVDDPTNDLSQVDYDTALAAAMEKNDPNECNLVTKKRFYSDYTISLPETIDTCKSQFAIDTGNLDYCMTLDERPVYVGSISNRDVCLKGLAKKLKKLELCDELYGGKDKQSRQNQIDHCKLSAVHDQR